METVTNFIFLGSKITVEKILKHLHLGSKAMTNLDEVFKRRYFTLPTKVCIVKAMVFLIVMYRCQSWITKLSAEELMLSKCGAGKDS